STVDAFWAWFWGAGWFWFTMFWAALLVNGRAAFKLLLDWKGMLTTCRFVERAYEDLAALPDEAALERDGAAPVFVHLVPVWQEPEIATTLRALLDSRYPHAKLHVVVAAREDEERLPHPAMEGSTAEVVRRFREGLPPWQQKMLSVVAMPGEGRKAHQLNWALRPEILKPLLDLRYDPARVWIGLSDADSIPDPNVYRWIAADLAQHRGRLAYQGVTLSLANFDRLDMPESSDGMIRQNARWYQGVLDDVAFLRGVWRARPSPYNLAQLCRHVGNKVVEWPIAAVVYPVLGFLGWHLAYRFSYHPAWFLLGVAFPSISLGLTVWVGGIVTQDLIESLTPHFPRRVNVARTTLKAKFWGIFRCQTYWLLATRGAWRVLWSIARTGRFEPVKTNRVVR